MVCKSDIEELLQTRFVGRNLLCYESIGSTNDVLKEMAPQLPDGTVVVAGEQTAGRGRRGNAWVSCGAQMAQFSVLLKGAPVTQAPPITLLCGLAVAQALNTLCGGGFLIKWPNDIVCGSKKVCGILCEAKISKTGSATVCGIGVNVAQSEEYFRSVGLTHAASLLMLKGEAPAAAQVIAAILNQLEQIYDIFSRGDTDSFFAEYEKMCVTLHKEVLVKTPDGELTGVAERVNPDGTLCVCSGEKEFTLSAGDVSVRGVMGYC